MEDILQAKRLTFEEFAELLRVHNEVMDLTAVPASETWDRHFRDSLELLNCADFAGARVIDIGSGAGFPGIPLKIACPSIDLTLLDAKEKRAEFMRVACAHLGITATVTEMRAEVLAHYKIYRDALDIAVSRAVARMNVLTELCLPFVKVGGVFLAMKGRNADAELQEAAGIIETLGGSVEDVRSYRFGNIVTVRKIAATPEEYPRRWKKIVG